MIPIMIHNQDSTLIYDESKITVYVRGDYRTTSPSSSALTAAKELGMAGSIITLPQQTTTRQQEYINDGNNSSAQQSITIKQ